MPEQSQAAMTRRRALGRRCRKIAKELEEIGAITLGTQVENDMQYLTQKEEEAVSTVASNSIRVAAGLNKLADRFDK